MTLPLADPERTAWRRALHAGQPIGCVYCDGSGQQPGPANVVGYRGEPRVCPNCHGTGAVIPDRSVY